MWINCLIIYGRCVRVVHIRMLFFNLHSFYKWINNFHILLMCSGTRYMLCWEGWRILNLTLIKLLTIKYFINKVMVYLHLYIMDIVLFLHIIMNILSTNKSVINHLEKWFPLTWLLHISHIHDYHNILILFLVWQEHYNIFLRVKRGLWRNNMVSKKLILCHLFMGWIVVEL